MFQKIKFFTLGTLVLMAVALSVWPNPPSVPTPEPTQTMTLNDYESHLVQLVHDENPAVALYQLKSFMQSDDEVLNHCHELLHEIGHAAFEKTGDFTDALLYQDEFCNAGYYHGVIEAFFSQVDDIESALKTVCEAESINTLSGWECFHGTGHGFMSWSGNDYKKSIELCNKHTDKRAQETCVNGVFMELFALEPRARAIAAPESEDALRFCEQLSLGAQDCYLYAPTLYLQQHPNDFLGALNWCFSYTNAFTPSCIHGVGSETMKQNFSDPSMVKKVCGSTDPKVKKDCFEGAIGLAILHVGGIEPIPDLCHAIEADEFLCQSVIQQFQTQFNL